MRRRGALALLLVSCFGLACVSPATAPRLSRTGPMGPQIRLLKDTPTSAMRPRAVVVRRARAFLNGEALQARGVEFPPDPVGFVRAAFWAAGIELFDAKLYQKSEADGMTLLLRSTKKREQWHREQPRPGDLVFFDGSPRADSAAPQQVAIVESVEADGTIHAVGHFAGGPGRLQFNLRATGGAASDKLSAGEQQWSASALFRTFANPFGY